MPIGVGKFLNPMNAKKAAIEAAKAKATGVDPAAAAITKYIPPGECPERIRLEFDDSGSMYGQIADAKRGVVEFLRNCVPNTTSVAVHFMNTNYDSKLQSNLPALGAEITDMTLGDGGTPFFNTLKSMLLATPKLTRAIVFTDGSPTDSLQAEESSELQGYQSFRASGNWLASADVIIKIAKSIEKDKCIPIDAVFFGSVNNHREIELLKYLSEATGGFFLHFNPTTPNIWKQLKYLAPVNRLALTDGAFRAAVERGEK